MRARSIKIIDLSVHTVATIPLGTSVLDCSKAMRALHVGSLVVINDDRQPVGMITDRDICIEVVALEKDPKGLKLKMSCLRPFAPQAPTKPSSML